MYITYYIKCRIDDICTQKLRALLSIFGRGEGSWEKRGRTFYPWVFPLVHILKSNHILTPFFRESPDTNHFAEKRPSKIRPKNDQIWPFGQIWPKFRRFLPSNGVNLPVKMTLLANLTRNSRNAGWRRKVPFLGTFWHQPALRELREFRKFEIFGLEFRDLEFEIFEFPAKIGQNGQFWPNKPKMTRL